MYIQCGKWNGIFQSQSPHCPVTLDQWDCFQSVPEEHGGKELFPNHQSNTDIFFSNLLLLPNKLSNDHQINAVLVNDDCEDRILSCKIQLLHRLPSVTFDCRRRLITFLERSYEARFCSDGSMSIHLLWCIGMVAVVPASSPAWGFAFAFDLAATTLMFVCGTRSSCGSAGICVVLNGIDHILDRSTGNSDPRLRIVLIYRPNSNFNSIFKVLQTGRDFQYRPNSHVSLDPPFWLRSSIISWKGVFATSHWAKLSKITSVLGHEILSHFNNTHKSCFLTKFTHSVFWWKRFNLLCTAPI